MKDVEKLEMEVGLLETIIHFLGEVRWIMVRVGVAIEGWTDGGGGGGEENDDLNQ